MTQPFGFDIICYANDLIQVKLAFPVLGVLKSGERWSLCYGWCSMGFLLLQLEEDLKRQKEAACFKARPNTVVYQEPFVPKKENKMLSGRVTSACYTGLAHNSELMQLNDV